MNDQGFDIVVVGNVGIDTAVYLPGADIDFDVESNFCENLDPGRAGKRLCCSGVCRGARKPAFIGYVDDDHNGRFMCETPARDGINTSIRFVAPWGVVAASISYTDTSGAEISAIARTHAPSTRPGTLQIRIGRGRACPL